MIKNSINSQSKNRQPKQRFWQKIRYTLFIIAFGITNMSHAQVTDEVKVSEDNSTIAISLKKDEDSVPFINVYSVKMVS